MNLKESRQRLRAAELQYSQAEPGRNLTVAREELTEARLYYANACIALVERLPELLWPFASEASMWNKEKPDDFSPFIGTYNGDMSEADFTLGDLRALAALHAEVWDE